MSQIRKKFYFAGLVITHTVALVLLNFYLLTLPYTYDNEAMVISWVSLAKNVLLGLEEKPAKEQFLFVNVAYEKQLVSRYDDYGFEIGNEAITDRFKLADFFQRVSQSNAHSFIVCDVFLADSSEADSALLSSVSKVERVLFPYHYIDDKIHKPVIPVPSALSDYQSDYGTFTKYSFLQYDTCSTIALAMHKSLSRATYTHNRLYALANNKPVLNSFIIDMPVRQADIFQEDTLSYSSIHLHNLLQLPQFLFDEMLKDRIVIVGDFLENDLHDTFYGTISGPLIHLNAFLALREQKNSLSWGFIIYLVGCNLILSLVLLSQTLHFRNRWIAAIQGSRIGWIFDYLKYTVVLLIISVISYLAFGIFLNILLLSLYFSVAENLLEFIIKKKS